MKNIFYIILVGIIFSCAQEKKELPKAIDFRNGTFKELLAVAEKEDKLIFIDCYTSWCAPCKWMDKNVFVNENVYSFYNSTFINYKIDMEKGEGPELAKKYQVSSYPTYLFINSKGDLVHKSTSRMSVEEFITVGENAIDPSKAFGILTAKYEQNKMSNDEMLNYAISLQKMRINTADEVLDKLMLKVDDEWLLSLSGWKLIESFVFDENSKLFNVLNSNKEYFISITNKKTVYKVYQRILQRKMYASTNEQNETLFFQQLDSLKKLTDKARDIAILHCNYYAKANDADKFIKTSNYYVDNFLTDDPETIAFIARSVYRKSFEESPKILLQAAELITKAYEMNPNDYGTVSTFAQIQGIVGNKEEAIKAGELAVKMADTISSKVKKRALQNLKELKEKQ
ncbi:thioredoxin family protein [Lutibacter aestuarii]|uniref:Thioredoxin family protein n=1 Tax=Lutibacter aestuarii TaxID=861111 RepID=A0ABW2Z6Q9_9FLAO